jgi:hypothetical protein
MEYFSAINPTTDYPDTHARVPVRNEPQSKFFGIKKLVAPLLLNNINRPPSTSSFGMNNLIAQLLNNNNNNNNNQLGLNQIFPTFTSTTFQTTTLTVTTPVIVSCISKNQFIGSTSTLPCSRRRRGIIIEPIEAIKALTPTPVEPLVEFVFKILTILCDFIINLK